MKKCMINPVLLLALAGSGHALAADPFSAAFELSSLLPANGGDGSTGFVLNGNAPGDFSGSSVSSAGDVNGDGIDDLIIGAFGADLNGMPIAGGSYVVFGRSLAPPPSPCAGDANGSGVVDCGDITSVLGNWLSVCP